MWSFIDKFASQFITFVVGIVMARLLTPADFGLIGMLTIFIALSSIFIQSGFNQALIRKTNCTEKDYATVFYFNLVISVLFYMILIFSSKLISNFYNESVLEKLIIVIGLTLIINALTIVQRTILIKKINFRLLTRISIIAAIGSGGLGIYFAYTGYGVWSLVYKLLAHGIITSGLLWMWNKWYPKEKFSFQIFKELFRFSKNLMLLGLIDTIYRNIYYLILGKFYPVENLGQYTKAQSFKILPAETMSAIVDRVSYPVLSSIQNDKSRYEEVFLRLLKCSSLITFVLLIGLSAISKEITIVLMGPQWAIAGEYLEILCFSVLFFPLDKMMSSILKIAGRSDLILKLGLIRKIMAIPIILTAIFVGIKPMLYVLAFQQLGVAILMISYGSKFVNLKPIRIFLNLMPALIISIVMFLALKVFTTLLDVDLFYQLLLKILLGTIISLGLFEITKNKDYRYLKNEAINKIRSIFKKI